MGRRSGPANDDSWIDCPKWMFALRILRQEIDKPLKWLIIFAFLFVLMSSALAALSPVLLKFIVDCLTSPGPLDGARLVTIGHLIAGYAAGLWIGRTLGELRSLAVGRADQRLHRNLSLRLFKHLMTLPFRFHVDRKSGALSQTLINGLVGYRLVIQHVVLTVVPVIVELCVISAVLVLLNQPVFMAIIAASLVCYGIAFAVGAVKLTNPARAASTAHIEAYGTLMDSFINYETIKIFCAEPLIHKRMEYAFTQTEDHWAHFFSCKAFNGILIATIFVVSLGVSVYVAAHQVQLDRMSIGGFVLVNAYMLQVFRPLETLGFAFLEVTQGMAFIEKMIALFQWKPEPAISHSGRTLPPGKGELIFDEVTFSYSSDHLVLRDISFRVPAGKTVALTGASGSGKSSLIRLLIRLYEPDSGRIFLDSMPISQASASSLRAAIAVVPQDTVLFNDTIAYNIGIGRADSTDAEIVEAARIAHIHDFIIARPYGYRTQVGERGLKLSGGEKQRIAIARAVLRKPRVFVFDEATSCLDSNVEQQILRNLAQISRGTTTLVIAHRLSTVVEADEILVLENGVVAERGTHPDLVKNNGVYQLMWDAQHKVYESQYSRAVKHSVFCNERT